jgi:fluoroquinolone resistance protein
MPSFHHDQSLLEITPAEITARQTVAPDHPVAGNEDRKRVPGAGDPDCTRGVRMADLYGQIPVSDRLPVRNLCQSMPNGMHERGSSRDERQAESGYFAGDPGIELPERLIQQGCRTGEAGELHRHPRQREGDQGIATLDDPDVSEYGLPDHEKPAFKAPAHTSAAIMVENADRFRENKRAEPMNGFPCTGNPAVCISPGNHYDGIMAHQQSSMAVGTTFTSLSTGELEPECLQYDECRFVRCHFSNANLSNLQFSTCSFEACDLSLASLKNTSLREVSFVQCKLLGVQFSECRKLLLRLDFSQCMLRHAVFSDLDLRNTRFVDCDLRESDFTRSDLSGAGFPDSDLLQALFVRSNLERADFRTARNYSFDPSENRLRGARFSIPGVTGLLDTFGIEID